MTKAKDLWSRSPHVAFVDDEAQVTLLNLLNLPVNTPEVLLGSGATVWRVLQQPRHMDEIATAVAAAIDLPTTKVAADIQSFLEDLRARGLVINKGSGDDGDAER